MTEILIIIAFLAWYVLAMVVSEKIGKKKKIGVEGSFLVSFMLSPLIGYLITLASPDSKTKN